MPKFIPHKLLMQIGLLLLPLAVVLTAYGAGTDSGLYHVLATQFGNSANLQLNSALLTLLINLISVLIIVVVMSLFTIKTPVTAAYNEAKTAVLKGPGTWEEKMVAVRKLESEQQAADPETAGLRQKALAVAIITAGIAMTAAGGISILITMGKYIFEFQIILTLTGIGMTIGGLIQLITGKKVTR